MNFESFARRLPSAGKLSEPQSSASFQAVDAPNPRSEDLGLGLEFRVQGLGFRLRV